MSLYIIKTGLFDTIQDGGRYGFQHLGISPGGPMDKLSAQLANALLGKDLQSPVLELSFPASSILFEEATILCITGATLSPTINGSRIPLNHAVYVPRGSLLEWAGLKSGRWSYLSIIHDLVLEQWLGSYSTNTKIGVGGYSGGVLRKGDQLSYKDHLHFAPGYWDEVKIFDWTAAPFSRSSAGPYSFLKGNEWQWLSGEAKKALVANTFVVSRQSDRMGYRLQAPPLQLTNNTSLVSSAACAGAIQLLPNGQAIVLMADHQTTGGYPRIGYITSTDLSYLAQCQPGNPIQFAEADVGEAQQTMMSQQKYLQKIKNACTFKMQNILHYAL